MAYQNDEVYAYDSLDQAVVNGGGGGRSKMEIDDEDDGMSGFANTEFDQRGMILSSAGMTPGRRSRDPTQSQSRPKSVNWPDDPANMSLDGESGILVNDDEWGEWGSSAPGTGIGNGNSTQGLGGGIRPPRNQASASNLPDPAHQMAGSTPGVGSHHISASDIRQDGQQAQPGALGARGGNYGGSEAITVGRRTPLQTFQIGNENAYDIQIREKQNAINTNTMRQGGGNALRSTLSRAVSRAYGNSIQNRHDSTGGSVAFGKDGFADDGVLPFGDMEVNAADAIGDQKYNNKYLEYRSQQLYRNKQGGVSGVSGNSNGDSPIKPNKHARTSTIVNPIEVLPPVITSKLVSQGIMSYDVLNKGVNLDKAIERDAIRRAQEHFKYSLDMDKSSSIAPTRKIAPRLDPNIEKTGFFIGSQLITEPPAPKREVQAEWVAQLQNDRDAKLRPLPGLASKKEYERRAFTPFMKYEPGEHQLAMNANSIRQEAMQRGELKRQELQRNRGDLLAKMNPPVNTFSLAELRKAKNTVGGKAVYAEQMYLYTSNGIATRRPPSRYEGFSIGEAKGDKWGN